MSDELGIPVAMMIADAYDQIKKQKKEITKLKQQLAERDELILELEKIREFYADFNNYNFTFSQFGVSKYERISTIDMGNIDESNISGGKLARTPLKNQALLDEIKGRV